MVKDAHSHSIELPVEFRCIVAKRRWVCGRARLLKVRIDHGGSNVRALVEVLAPAEDAGKKISVDLSDLPIAILGRLEEEARARGISFWPSLAEALLHAGEPSRNLHFETVHSDLQFDVVVGTNAGAEQQTRQIDLEELERTFRELNEKEIHSLAAFFRRFGAWSSDYDPTPAREVEDVSRDFEPDPPHYLARLLHVGQTSTVIVVPELIWRERLRIGAETQMANNDAYLWFSLNKLPARFETRPEFPHFVLTERYCLDALRTSISLHLLRGEKYSICARPGCNTPFIAQGKQLKYHHSECGRIVSRMEDRKKKQAAARELRMKSTGSDR